MGHEPRSVALSGRSALAHPVRAFATFSNAHTKSLLSILLSLPVLAVSQTCTIPHRATWRSWVLDQAAPTRPLPESCHARRFSLLPDRSRNREERPRRETERPGPRSLALRGDKREAAGERPWAARPTTTSPRCSSAFRNSPVRSSSDSQLVCHLRSVDTSHSLSSIVLIR